MSRPVASSPSLPPIIGFAIAVAILYFARELFIPLAFAVLLAFLFARHGGVGFLLPRVPATHWVWHGGNPPAAIFVWYVIALSTLVDPGFFQRAFAAKDPQVARRGVLWSIAFWILFDFMTTTAGMYARALLPHLLQGRLRRRRLGALLGVGRHCGRGLLGLGLVLGHPRNSLGH